MNFTVSAPYMVSIAKNNSTNNSNAAPKKHQLALTNTGAWCITPIAPFNAITKLTTKNAGATMSKASGQLKPIETMPAALKASDTW
jgi:hypothetical protein